MPLSKGIPAPNFKLLDETATERKLSDYFGKPIVLYFYPKDDTPGCTKEACSFRDDYSDYLERGVVILGVSPDTPEKHTKFKQKFQLPFTLLSDVDHQVCELYGVWGKKKMRGKEYYGVLRTTFIIDENGVIISVFEKVRPADHSSEILAELNQ
jgi:thioredoxin-dependent peroxiredoxin